MSGNFVEFLIVAVLSLVITFVLFRWLESRAEAESPLLGGTIKYGGALAGFVLVFWLSSYLDRTMFSADAKTAISLDGEYDMLEIDSNRQTSKGSATIRQDEGRTSFDITGEVESTQNPPSISFHTITGIMKERRLVWLYENELGEMGIALGDVQSNRPDRIVVTYGDVLGTDLNEDVQGRLVLTRRKPAPPAP
jgi:hypothetical protein